MKLHKTWNSGREKEGLFKGADAIAVVTGSANEDELYSKSASLQNWLLGYEFPDTCIVIGNRSLTVLTSAKKVQYLQPLVEAENATLPLELIASEKKSPDKNRSKYAQLVSAIKSSHSGVIVGCLLKEKPQGEFATLWKEALAADTELEQVELNAALADIMSTKDATEQACVKRAAIFSAVVMQKHVVPMLEGVVDEEKKIAHEKIAEGTEDIFQEPSKLGVKLSPEFLESCYTPIIQSGGKFDLKPSAFSNGDNLYYGTITCSLGARYKSYCSNVGRTYIINPSKGQEKTYKLLLELQQAALDVIRPGAKLSAVMTAVQLRLKSKAPHLEPHLTKSCGFATGLEFRESAFQLNSKSEQVFRAGMVFNLALGLENLEDKDATDSRGKKYALFLAETVLVKEEGANEVLTERAPKQWGDISYYLKDDDEEEDAGPSKSSKTGRGNVEILESRTRGAGKQHEVNQEAADALQSHQSELEEQMRTDALERLQSKDGKKKDDGASQATPVAYRDANQYPTANQSSGGGPLRTHQTFVDGKQEAVLIPIHGRLVPFHISTVKNVSKSEEGGWTYLRINFVAPAASVSAQQLPPESAEASHWIRELTLKAKVPTNLNNTFRLIKELRKRVVARAKEAADLADVIVQEELQVIRTGKIHRLRDVNVRPNVGGKKAPGTLEIHSTGLRFQAARGEKLDLIFKNVKLAFYQPAEKEILVIMHFHLHHPIMIGKKKTKDVQFYVEVMEASYSLDQTRRSGYDPDELEEEQRERAMRVRMNQEFQNFVKKIEEQAKDLEFDIPYRDLGFYGVPNKSTSFIMPAVNALVELTEPPWLVVALNDIEVAHFERVVYGLKNFDLVLVLKDFSQKPLQINSINMEHLEPLKSWLDSCNIKFYEGTANLNWNSIMKHVNDIGLEGFYDDGGWKFLNMQGSSDEEEGESDNESEFAPSGSDSGEEESDEDSEGSDFVDSDEGSGEESLDSDESEGQDWDEAEKLAKEKDRRKESREEEEDRHKGGKGKAKKREKKHSGSSSGSDSDRPAPKKPKGGGSSSGSKPFKPGKSSSSGLKKSKY